jgi:hypothetical protein
MHRNRSALSHLATLAGFARMRGVRFGLLATCSAITALAVAGPREEVFARAARCASLVDDAAWLACYRAAAAPMEASLAAAITSSPPAARPAPPAPAAPSAPVPAAAADVSRFGILDHAQSNALSAPAEKFHPAPETASSEHITAHLLKYSFSSQKYFTVVLDNGQVWQQINGDDDFAILKRAPSEYEVTIKHGLFGGYNLTITGVAGLFRVRRIA